jgi:hypothetical protein
MTKYKLYCNANTDIGIFEGETIFITEREKEKCNNIEAVSLGFVYEKSINIQLTKEPTMVARNKKWHNLWIGEPSADIKEFEILYPIPTHNESIAMELAQVIDGIGVK